MTTYYDMWQAQTIPEDYPPINITSIPSGGRDLGEKCRGLYNSGDPGTVTVTMENGQSRTLGIGQFQMLPGEFRTLTAVTGVTILSAVE